MVVDDQMRPLFAFLRAISVPTSLFAPEDWNASELSGRISRAGNELVRLVLSGVGSEIAGTAWHSYQHQLGSDTAREKLGADDINFDTDLMRLATGER